MKGFFITATDTDAGKTFVGVELLTYLSALGFKTLAFKPIASGCEATATGFKNDDAKKLLNAANVSLDYSAVNPYAFEPAIAPHIAAQQAGVSIDIKDIVRSIHQQQHKADFILVEGVGGWLVPLNEHETIADLARILDYAIILVVNMRLGCINHTMLTVQAIENAGLTMCGWIANNYLDNMKCPDENILSLKSRLKAPLLGVLPNLGETHVARNKTFSEYIDMQFIMDIYKK